MESSMTPTGDRGPRTAFLGPLSRNRSTRFARDPPAAPPASANTAARRSAEAYMASVPPPVETSALSAVQGSDNEVSHTTLVEEQAPGLSPTDSSFSPSSSPQGRPHLGTSQNEAALDAELVPAPLSIPKPVAHVENSTSVEVSDSPTSELVKPCQPSNNDKDSHISLGTWDTSPASSEGREKEGSEPKEAHTHCHCLGICCGL